jgi:hypothetical protein
VSAHAHAADESEAPSAELLLYLAEFADDNGKPDDPVAVDRELAAAPETTPPVTSEDDQPDPPQAPAQR